MCRKAEPPQLTWSAGSQANARQITSGSFIHRLGTYALIVGATLTLTGLVLGFGFMFAGHEGAMKRFLTAVPLGFMIGFVGMAMTLLGDPGAND